MWCVHGGGGGQRDGQREDVLNQKNINTLYTCKSVYNIDLLEKILSRFNNKYGKKGK